MNSDDVKCDPISPERGPDAQVPASSVDDGARDGAMRMLHVAGGALRSGVGREVRARIPLEQLERELLRVMHIELASMLVRARDLVRRRCANHEALHESWVVLALQCEARESIDVARACGVRVPRIVLRLVADGPATWPSAARFERWARHLDPDVDCASFPVDVLSR